MARVHNLFEHDLKGLGLSEESRDILISLRAAMNQEYQERFLEMSQALNRQAAALERIQGSLAIVIEAMDLDVSKKLPVAFGTVTTAEESDVATVKVAADPIGMGFTLCGEDIARALRIDGGAVSALIQGLKLRDDPALAIAIRQGTGSQNTLYSYREAVVDRLRECIHSPPEKLSQNARAAMARARRKMGLPGTW